MTNQIHTELNKLADMKPKTFLKNITLERLEKIAIMADKMADITSIFSEYKPMDKGNTKLADGILSFSLLPVVTCDQHCKGCYDVRSLRYRAVRMKRLVNTVLVLNEKLRNEVFQAMYLQVIRSKTVTAVRIHVGGDFFSKEYAEKWGNMAQAIKMLKPEVKVYTYTKTAYANVLKCAGINVVKSRYEFGHFNFADKAQVFTWAKQYNGKVCPATVNKNIPDKFCGSKCTFCQDTERVFFVIH